MEFTRTVEREFATPPKAVLHVEARSGAVSVETHAKQQVIIEAILRVWADHEVEVDEAALLVERGMTQDDQQRVIVRAPSLPQSEGWSFWGKRGARVDYNIRVPSQTAVRVLSRSGRIGVSGTVGRAHVESGSGRVTLQDITGDVNAVSRSGAMSIERVEGNVTVEARSGRLELRRVSGNTAVQSRSGVIDLREIDGDIEARAHTGSITIERPGGGVYARAHTGAIRFSGKIEGDVALSAQTGTISMAVDPQQGFFLDAESDTGTVRSDLPPRRGGSGAPPEGGPKVRLRTHTGSIRLVRL